jgi:putative flippase GtrA
MILQVLALFVSTVLQNASFTLVSRARNTKSLKFHALASVASNGVWLLVIRQIVTHLDSWAMMATYLVGSVIGSVVMHYISMTYFEKKVKT